MSVVTLKTWNVNTILDYVKKSLCKFHAFIDTGALITGISNEEVARSLLKDGLDGLDACVFFNSSDQQMIINRAGVVMLLSSSGISEDKRFTFFDQIHTTGMDVKQCSSAHALHTISADMTLRDYSQG